MGENSIFIIIYEDGRRFAVARFAALLFCTCFQFVALPIFGALGFDSQDSNRTRCSSTSLSDGGEV